MVLKLSDAEKKLAEEYQRMVGPLPVGFWDLIRTLGREPLRGYLLASFENEHPICIVCEEPVKTKYWHHARLDVYICDSCPKDNVCGENVLYHAMRYFDETHPEWLPNNPAVICYR